MWNLRKINLLEGCDSPGSLLLAEEIESYHQAEAILAEAQQQANEILASARQEADEYIAEQRRSCEGLFWQQAEVVMGDWQQQREQEASQLTSLAEKLLSQAMKQLLSDFSPEQRFSALLQQLLRQHSRQKQATLYCATHQQTDISEWLKQQAWFEWQLRGDDSLEEGQLKLVTESGELFISWDAICQQMLPDKQQHDSHDEE